MKPTIALTLLLFVSPLHAQFTETVEVRLTNVDAIVTDKNGNPVTGLTKDDFEIYEEGARQEITHFNEIFNPRGVVAAARPAGAAPANPNAPEQRAQPDSRRRLITALVDLQSLEPANRGAVLPELQKFLTSNMRTGDEVAIYSWGDTLTVELQPTSNPAAIQGAIDRIAAYPTERTTFWRQELQFNFDRLLYEADSMRAERPYFEDGMAVARRAAERATNEMRQKTEAIKSVLSTLRGEDGRKVLVLLTQSLSVNPAEEAFYYFYTQRNRFQNGRTLKPNQEARRYEVKGLAEEVVAAANNAGVTLYPLHTAGKFNEVSDVDATKGGTHRTVAMDPMRVQRPADSQLDPRLLSLSAASDETGGRALAGSGNWKNAFDIVSTELNAYYSIGYRAQGEAQDRTKKIEVRLKDKGKGYIVRTRKTVIEQTPASAMRDLVAANLFHTPSSNDLAVKAGIGSATTAGENLVHPLTITIPTSTLTLVPEGSDLVGKLSVFAAFLRADGAVSSVGPQLQQFRFPAASLAKRKEVTVKLDVSADAQVGAISLGVMDDVSNATGFALLTLTPAPAAPATPATSGATK
jgi:VWFA-related protein